MAYNAVAQAYSDKIMNEWQASLTDEEKQDIRNNLSSDTQYFEQMKQSAFSNARDAANEQNLNLRGNYENIQTRLDGANEVINALKTGDGSKKIFKDFGLNKKEYVTVDGLESQKNGIQGNDEASANARAEIDSKIENIKGLTSEQERLVSKYTADSEKNVLEQDLSAAEAELAGALMGNDEAKINAAATEYAKFRVAYYEKYEANQPVNSQADAKARTELANEMQRYKEMLGMSEPAKTAETTAPKAETATPKTETPAPKTETTAPKTEAETNKPEQPKPAESSEVKTETVETEVESKDVKADIKEPVQVEINDAASKNDKPNPYAFEKPPQPSGMPSSAYEAMCKQQEEAHIREVNEKVADEIWTKGNWGNGQERIDKLTAAGYDVAGVQAVIEEKVAAMNKTAAVKTVKEPVASAAKSELSAEASAPTDTAKKSDVTVTHDEENRVDIKSWTDENGNKITERYYDESRGLNGQRFGREVECPDGSKYEIGYSLGGNKESEVYTKPDGTTRVSRWTDGNKKSVEYFGTDGKLTSGKMYDGTPEERLMKEYAVTGKSLTVTDYDRDGNSTRRVCNPDGSLQSVTVKDLKADKTIETTYNKDGFKDIETTYKGTAQGYSKKPLQIVKYDGTEAENKVADTTYDHESHTKVERTYDKNGKETSEEIIDMSPDEVQGDGVSGVGFGSESDEKSDESAKKKTMARKSLSDGKTTNDDKAPERTDKDKDKDKDKDSKDSKEGNSKTDDTVKKFNPYVNEPAFNPYVDEPTFDPTVNEPKFDPYLHEKSFNPYLEEEKPKKKTTTKKNFDAAASMADGIKGSGKSAEAGYDASDD